MSTSFFETPPGWADEIRAAARALRETAASDIALYARPVVQAVLSIVWIHASVVFLLLWAHSSATIALAVISTGLAAAGGLFMVAHNSLHQSIVRSKRLNYGLGLLASPLGLTAGWWKAKHNVLHHAHTNDPANDDSMPLVFVRLSPYQQWRPHHRFQYLYVPLLFPLMAIAMFFSDAVYVLTGRLNTRKHGVPSLKKLGHGLAEKLALPAIILTAAFRTHSAMSVLAGTFAVLLVAGLSLSLVFGVNHFVEGNVYPDTDSRLRGDAFLMQQVRGTCNYAPKSRLVTWYTGGLNLHIEHHLFPSLPHQLLPLLAPQVKAICERHGVPYNEFRTHPAAFWAFERNLRAMSRPTTVASAYFAQAS